MTKNITGFHRKYVEFEDLDYSTNYIVKVGIGCPRFFPSLNQCFQRFSVPPVDNI